MTDFRVTYFWTAAIEFDINDLRDEFPEAWDNADGDEQTFIEDIVEEYGFSYLEEMDFLTSSETYKGYVEVEKVE